MWEHGESCKLFLNAIEGFVGEFVFSSGFQWLKCAKKRLVTTCLLEIVNQRPFHYQVQGVMMLILYYFVSRLWVSHNKNNKIAHPTL
jgi:hypothetical protein